MAFDDQHSFYGYWFYKYKIILSKFKEKTVAIHAFSTIKIQNL